MLIAIQPTRIPRASHRRSGESEDVRLVSCFLFLVSCFWFLVSGFWFLVCQCLNSVDRFGAGFDLFVLFVLFDLFVLFLL